MLTPTHALALTFVLGLAALGGGCAGTDAQETESPPPPVLGECKGRGCVSTTVAIPQPGRSTGGGPAAVREAAPNAELPGSTRAPAEITLGGHTGLGADGPLTNPNTTGPGYGAIPPGGPGPGAGPGYNGGAAPVQLGPVCPAEQPSPGAPCDPSANSFACTYGQVTCSCNMTWVCF